ncbi:MAG TPA: hypothetical protein VGF99_13500 [Myxococcota bacterium]
MRSLVAFSAVSLTMAVLAAAGFVAQRSSSSSSSPSTLYVAPIASGFDGEAEAAAVDGVDDVVDLTAVASLQGLWSRHPDTNGRDDEPMGFYYFHEGDIGLYRYGQVGHNATNSYTWRVVDTDDGNGVLELRFKKTGVVERLAYRIEKAGDRPVLVLARDPKQPDVVDARYTWVPPPALSSLAPDLVDADIDVVGVAGGLDHRLWIDQQPFATGGFGFRLYQWRVAGIDGRGTGWLHVGDYDDWTTESLRYRLLRGADGVVDRIDLTFSLRGDQTTTSLRVLGDGDQRRLLLANDPRDFGAAHVYVDGGPSFASFMRR